MITNKIFAGSLLQKRNICRSMQDLIFPIINYVHIFVQIFNFFFKSNYTVYAAVGRQLIVVFFIL